MNTQTTLKKQYSQINNKIFQINNKLIEKRNQNAKLIKIQFQTPTKQTLSEKYLNLKKAINQLQQEIDTLQKDIQSLEAEKNNIGDQIDQLEEAL